MKEGHTFTILRLTVAVIAFSYILYIGITIEEFNPVLLAAILACLIPDLTKVVRKLSKSVKA